MPYKDPAKRREAQKRYRDRKKQRQIAQTAIVSSPDDPAGYIREMLDRMRSEESPRIRDAIAGFEFLARIEGVPAGQMEAAMIKSVRFSPYEAAEEPEEPDPEEPADG